METQSALDKINTYRATLNGFLEDSQKEVVFKEDTSEMKFCLSSSCRESNQTLRDIKNLSSGEQQLLILFSYLAFNSKDGRIFIIDEPELSLHVKWQEDFLDAIEKIMPQNTQIIMATHSPILVSKKKGNTILLKAIKE